MCCLRFGGLVFMARVAPCVGTSLDSPNVGPHHKAPLRLSYFRVYRAMMKSLACLFFEGPDMGLQA